MKGKKRLILLTIPLLLILSGCAQASTEATGLWNFLVISFAKSIVFFGGLAGGSLGWGIVLMTLAIRLILLPLYGIQIKSSEKMKEIQPQINALNKKYANNKGEDAQRKKAMEMQAIYKENSINPLAGCLPVLLQLPLLIAFYEAIEYLVPPQSVIDQLQAQGQTVIYGLQELNATDFSTVFFGFELGERVVIFALIAAITTFLTTYISMIGQEADGPGAGAMKGMLYVMPIMIFVLGLSMPGALSIYWLIGNTVSIIQTLYFKRSTIQTLRQRKKIETQK